MRSAARALLFVLLCALVFEVGSRAWWWLARGVPPWRPRYVTVAFFPELRHGLRSVRTDERYDVLLLGGSALNYAARTLERTLAERLDREVSVRNTAWPSHSTRDSLVKYAFLEDSRFDLVLFYHGINEVRANNVPPERFRIDYSHYWWYETVNALSSHRELARVTAPFTLRYLWLQLVDRFGWREYVPQHSPREDWTQYGGTIRTEEAFRKNLSEIVALAERRGDPLLLMTFAWFLPDGYTEERFRAGELPYVEIERQAFPVEIWGVAENVVAGIEAHNAVIREVAAVHPDAHFVDQEARMPRSGELFGDVCHLSKAGLAIFAENVADAVAPSAAPAEASADPRAGTLVGGPAGPGAAESR